MSTMRPLLLALALSVLLVGCGSSAGSGGPSSRPSEAASAGPSGATSPGPSSDTGSSAEPSASEGGGGGGDAGIPAIADGAWTTSKVHVEISGDKSATVDLPMTEGAGYTAQGFTILNFGSATQSAIVTLSQEADSAAIVVTTSELSTGGGFGDTCDLRITKNDASALAGEFECKGVDGVSTTKAEAYKLDLRGTFEAAR